MQHHGKTVKVSQAKIGEAYKECYRVKERLATFERPSPRIRSIIADVKSAYSLLEQMQPHHELIDAETHEQVDSVMEVSENKLHACYEYLEKAKKELHDIPRRSQGMEVVFEEVEKVFRIIHFLLPRHQGAHGHSQDHHQHHGHDHHEHPPPIPPKKKHSSHR